MLPFEDVLRVKGIQNFCKKILNYMVVGACQSLNISRQNIWFLENNRGLSKFFYGILHYRMTIIKL